MANNNSLRGVFLASDGKLREVKSIVIGNTVFNKQIDDNTPQNFLEKILKDNEKYLINETPKYNSINGTGLYKHNGSDYSGGDQPIYFYRGDVNNNWVVFGKDGSNYIWWRIIRNNSNGSIRMIYAGLSDSKTTAPATTGSGTQIGTKAFNTSYNNNMYVGFKYTSGQVHGTGTASTILGAKNSTDATTLYGWYNTKLKTNYGSYIDINAGFCNDRTPHSGSGTGTTQTYYAAYNRLYTNKAPSLLCTNADDIFKTPVGLITADEVAMAGMVNSNSMININTYLYTNSHYWTMSPCYFKSTNEAYNFYISMSGILSETYVGASSFGVRPVINLKADTKVTGVGTATNPYVVQT